MLQKKQISHDELVDSIFNEFRKASKRKYTSLFLSSLSTNNLNWRSGLPVFAIMQSFPQHIFEVSEASKPNPILFDKMSKEDKIFVINRIPCKHCGSFREIKIDIGLIKDCFYGIGGLVGFDILDYYYYLSETNKLKEIKPREEDFRIFSEILTILEEADEKDTVKKIVQSKIGKIKGFKSNKEQRKVLLETLGYCSIIETHKHKGLLNQYTNLATAPTKTHSSDWSYPVDFWLGKNGVNKEALNFWFGGYREFGLDI